MNDAPCPRDSSRLCLLASLVTLAIVVARPSSPAMSAGAQSSGSEESQPAKDLHLRYGFSGLIISKLNDGFHGVTSGDLNGDGLNDLVLVNNPKSKIEFLMQRGKDAPPKKSEDDVNERRVNDLEDETYFARESHPTEERVYAVVVRDLDRDSRSDLAFVGDSGKLSIVLREQSGRFSDPVRFPVEDPVVSSRAIHSGDLNGDDQLDLIVLCKEKTCLFTQDSPGHFVPGSILPNARKETNALEIADLNGDGRLDLVFIELDSERPFSYRLGLKEGGFSAARSETFAAIRSYAIEDVDGDGAAEIAAVRRKSGRLSLLKLRATQKRSAEPLSFAPLEMVTYRNIKEPGKRTELLADLDGDHMLEWIVTEPAAASVLVYRSASAVGFGEAEAEPSFLGVSQPRLGDVDGDGKKELLVVSSEEGALGLCTIGAERHLSFPKLVKVAGGEILALDLDDPVRSPQSAWVLLASGKGRVRAHEVRRFTVGGEPQLSWKLENLGTDPTDLLRIDFNRDGNDDVVLFMPKEPPRILIARPDNKEGFEMVAAKDVPGLGVLGELSPQSSFVGDLDGDQQPEMLVPGTTFARAFYLGADLTPVVVGQFNLDDPNALVCAAAAADLDGDGSPEIALADKNKKLLHLLRRDGADFRAAASIELGDFVPWSIRPGDVDGNGSVDLLLAAAEKFAVLRTGDPENALEVISEFESPLKDAFLNGIALGDVNGDSIVEVVVVEVKEHLLEIAQVKEGRISHVLKFPVFETRIFEGEGRGGNEPREVLICDATGDQKEDIVILVHDRVIVYPQE